MMVTERAEALLAEADDSLSRRECGAALTAYDWAEHAGADEDRCAAGRWMASMLLGRYEAAWFESDAIRARGAPDAHRFWNGESIDGKRVMLRCLHGYGDTVMYLRWLPEMRRRCSEVVVQACPEMLPLIGTMVRGSESASQRVSESAVVRVVSWTADGQSDRAQWEVQVECAELPYLFRATTATLPDPAQMVFAEDQMRGVRARLGERVKPRIGMVWTGSGYDPARSISFDLLRPMLENAAFEFWSLQALGTGEAWEQFCRERGWSGRTFYSREAATGEVADASIADMAAFASEMDLVITIDTLAAHVAGSLGLPTWVLLKREADWRWMVEREDSPWYPTMRLFRQNTAGDWDGTLSRVSAALRDFCEEQNAWV